MTGVQTCALPIWVILRVRIGWSVKTETVFLNQAYALAGTPHTECG